MDVTCTQTHCTVTQVPCHRLMFIPLHYIGCESVRTDGSLQFVVILVWLMWTEHYDTLC